MYFVHHLTWAVVDIGTQGQVDFAFLSHGHLPFEQGMIDFVDAAMQEEVLQLVVLLIGQRDEHQTTCIHVEAMHDEGPFSRWNGAF